MSRLLLGAFILAHGLVTIAIWAPDPHAVQPAPPMDTSRSWLLGNARSASVTLAIVAGLVIAVAGAGFLAHQQWWAPVGLVGGVLSLALFTLFFSPWWLAGIAISGALVFGAIRATAL